MVHGPPNTPEQEARKTIDKMLGLSENLPVWYRPLPFCYQSTGVETRFTNDLDPVPRSKDIFSFHRPETFEEWLNDDTPVQQEKAAEKQAPFGNLPL